jgi:hypothetical protein
MGTDEERLQCTLAMSPEADSDNEADVNMLQHALGESLHNDENSDEEIGHSKGGCSPKVKVGRFWS